MGGDGAAGGLTGAGVDVLGGDVAGGLEFVADGLSGFDPRSLPCRYMRSTINASASTVRIAMIHGKLLTAQFKAVFSPHVFTSVRPHH